MKLDMEAVREILLFIDESNTFMFPNDENITINMDAGKKKYHLLQMRRVNLITFDVLIANNGSCFLLEIKMTDKGYLFTSHIKNDNHWKEIKRALSAINVKLSFSSICRTSNEVEIKNEEEETFNEENSIRGFIEENCIVDSNVEILKNNIYNEYENEDENEYYDIEQDVID